MINLKSGLGIVLRTPPPNIETAALMRECVRFPWRLDIQNTY